MSTRKAGMFGKLPAKEDPLGRTLKFAKYLTPALPPAPATFDALPRSQKATGVRHISQLYGMLGNDVNGDCVMAMIAKAITLWESFDGKKVVQPASSVVDEYYKRTGGQDTGMNELDQLNFWRQNGFFSNKILAFARVNWQNHDELKSAVSLFGCVLLGFACTDQTLPEFNNRQTWTPGRPNGQGHAVPITTYGPRRVGMLTWGSTQFGSYAWVDEMVDEAYVCLPGEATVAGFAPGFNFQQLQSDLALVTA